MPDQESGLGIDRWMPGPLPRASIEEVLEDLTEIAAEKGIPVQSVNREIVIHSAGGARDISRWRQPPWTS